MATKNKSNKPAVSARAAADALQGGTNVVPVHHGALALPPGVKAKRALSLPVLVMKKAGDARTLVFLSNLQVSRVPGKEGEAPATVASVADVETGEQMIYLVPAVVESTILQTFAAPGTDTKPARENAKARHDLYESVPLAGMTFYIRNEGKKKESQRHVDFTVVECEPAEVSPAA